MAPVESTVSLHLLQPFVRYMEAMSIPVGPRLQELLDNAGLALGEDDADKRVSHDTAVDLLETAAFEANDPALGIHVCSRTVDSDFGLLGYAARFAATVGEATEIMNRYIALVHDGLQRELHVEGDRAEMRTWFVPGLRPSRVANDFIVASSVQRGRRNTGLKIRPEVHLMHGAPSDLTAYEEYFGGIVRFDMPFNAICFEAAGLALENRGANPERLSDLTERADTRLRDLSRNTPFVRQVRDRIVRSLVPDGPTLGRVARAMSMSERTVARRLEEENSTYKELVDEVRMTLARVYLADARVAIGETAFLLGYAHETALTRAVRRWWGVTPSEFRRDALASTDQR